MSRAIEKLEAAQKRAMAIRPKVGGFPYLAEVLRQAGVKRNLWFLPSCQSASQNGSWQTASEEGSRITCVLRVPATPLG